MPHTYLLQSGFSAPPAPSPASRQPQIRRGKRTPRLPTVLWAVTLLAVLVLALFSPGCQRVAPWLSRFHVREQKQSGSSTPAPTASPGAANPGQAPGSPAAGSAGAGTGEARNIHNLLIVGTDAGGLRTDVILLAHLDWSAAKVDLVWIPRDTRVQLAVKQGAAPQYAKINAANVYGGMDLLKHAVADLTGIWPDAYVRMSFAAFEKVVDLLGGVTLQVERPMNYQDRHGGLDIHIPAGTQHLTGKTALEYVRYRADGRGDIGRIFRQQRFVLAAFGDWLALAPRMAEILPRLVASVRTDLTASEAAAMASAFLRPQALAPDRLHLLPGTARYIGGISYWVADKQRAQATLEKLRTDF